VSGSVLQNIDSSSAYALLKPTREKHKIKLGIKNPKENQKIEIWISLTEKKKVYKIALTIGLA